MPSTDTQQQLAPDLVANALNRLRDQLQDNFATRGTDAGMTPEEAQLYAGPPPGPAELEELVALAGDVAGRPARELCAAGFSVVAGFACADCPRSADCGCRS